MNNPQIEETAKLDSWRRFTNQKFLEWQQQFGVRKTVTEFASYIGFPQGKCSPRLSMNMDSPRQQQNGGAVI